MDKPLDRRRIMALAGATGGVSLATARAAATGSRDGRKTGKQVIDIPKDNPVLASSIGAYEKFGYSPAVLAGGLLFIAGQIGRRIDGGVGDVAEQTRIALNRTREILRLAGLTMADLVEVVSYHVRLEENLAAFMAVKAHYTERPYPAWSIIGVEALASPALMVEIRSVAAFRDG